MHRVVKTRGLRPRAKAALQAKMKFRYGERYRNRRKLLEPREADFFDAASVTEADVREWLTAVVHLDPDSPRAAAYVENYRVVEKIREAKAHGRYRETIARGLAGWVEQQ